MPDNLIPINFVTDTRNPIEWIIKSYDDGRNRPMKAKDVTANGGPTNGQQISRVGLFLESIGILEKPSGNMSRQLTPIGRDLAQALKRKNDLESIKCWQAAMVSNPNMHELLIQIRSQEPYDKDKFIDVMMKIIKTNLLLRRSRMNPKSVEQAANSIWGLVTDTNVLRPGKGGGLIIDKAVLFQRDKQEKASVTSPIPHITSDVVEVALNDAEALMRKNGPTSAVDRTHTALHGYLKTVCDDCRFQYKEEASLTELFAILKNNHPALQAATRSNELNKVLRGLSTIMDALNFLRNKASIAHPNADLLGDEEAMLAVNAARTTLHYLDAKLSINYTLPNEQLQK